MKDIHLPVHPFDKKMTEKKIFGVSFFPGNPLRNKLIVVLLLVVSIGAAFIIANTGISVAFLILIGIIALPLIYTVIAYPKVGIVIMLIFAYFIGLVARFNVSFPLGTIMDGLEILLIFGFLLNQKYQPEWKIYKNPVAIVILVWIGYNILEVVNPYAESRLAWLYTVRSVALVMLFYFILVYYLRDINFVRFIIKLWIALSLIAALYCLKQEFIGFFGFEYRSLENPILKNLMFIDGHWRKFSIFSDPVAFSYNMVASSLLCFSLLWGPFSIGKKIVLGFLTALFLFSMLYSGTRSAYILFPVSLVLFAILKFNKKILLLMGVFGLLIVFLIFVPTSNLTLYRFQTAFRPSNDASYLLRKNNQKKIQPYIRTHPIGGGLGSTGVWGKRFSPSSYLANLPPDSGYVRVAVELGWMGLLIFCSLMFIILKTGITNYYKIRDPEFKTYCLAMVLIVFALNLGNYPQEAIVQFPLNVYFCLFMALITSTLFLDKEKASSNN